MSAWSQSGLVGLVFVLLLSLSGETVGAEVEEVKAKKPPKSASAKLMLSIESPFREDLKSLAELIVEPRELDSWKNQGVVSGIVPSLFGKSNKRLPKFFVLNLFNPFAGKQYGYTDPLAPYQGRRTTYASGFDVKTADMKGVPLFGTPW